ncbi:hypothetical protein GA0115246_106543 [Streptomyces sp. SolWspMP-sol7th]|nr:hypothetical protein GA0115246_106543 [Streptomyces sp. SolWspMP-sol7th]
MFPSFPRTHLARRRARAVRPAFPRPHGHETPYPKRARRRAVVSGAVCATVLVALAGAGSGEGTGPSGGADGTRETLRRVLERERLSGEHVRRSGVTHAGSVTRITLDGARPGGEELVLLCRGGGVLELGTEPAQPLGASARSCAGAVTRLRARGTTTVEMRADEGTGDVAWAVASYRR